MGKGEEMDENVAGWEVQDRGRRMFSFFPNVHGRLMNLKKIEPDHYTTQANIR